MVNCSHCRRGRASSIIWPPPWEPIISRLSSTKPPMVLVLGCVIGRPVPMMASAVTDCANRIVNDLIFLAPLSYYRKPYNCGFFTLLLPASSTSFGTKDDADHSILQESVNTAVNMPSSLPPPKYALRGACAFLGNMSARSSPRGSRFPVRACRLPPPNLQ